MTITLAGYNFEAPALHGTVDVAPWNVGKVIKKFFAIVGDYQLTGAKHDKLLTIHNILWKGYATHLAAQSAIATSATYQEGSGTLTVDLGGGDSSNWTNAIFLGLQLQAPPNKDGSGVHGWMFRGQLQFRQQASE
jgi:hypothetical protein